MRLVLPQKVIIDADPGIGDALAVALALADPEVDLLGVTATAGRVSGRDATRNLQAIVERLDPPKWPRVGNSEAPTPSFGIGIDVGVVDPTLLSGKSGLGDLEVRAIDLHRPHESAKLMIDLVRNSPHEVTLLTLGPLTNVEVACERAPEFLDLLKEIVCLGGSIAAGGDVTAAAEFNVYANPEAARNVLRSPATKTLVPLDTTRRVILTFDKFNRLNDATSSPLVDLVRQLLTYSFRAHHEHLGIEGVELHELTALAAIARPHLFKRQMMAIDVETGGELTRGVTIFDRRRRRQWPTNLEIASDPDVQGILDYVTSLIQDEPH